MLIGAHVRGGRTLTPALDKAAEIGAQVVQIFTQSPRAWRPTLFDDDAFDNYEERRRREGTVAATFCHASYLINLAADSAELLGKSRACLAANLDVVEAMGADGLILHLGSHKGAGLAARLSQVTDCINEAVDDHPSARFVIENTAGAGGTIGRSFEEIAMVIEACGNRPELAVCLDTQHLWAAGLAYRDLCEADALVTSFADIVGLGRLVSLHVNDSKVELGSERDRHANPGEGTIGEHALACLLGHPALDRLPAILEVAGDGDGPRRQDLDAIRHCVALGRTLWA